MREEKTYRDIEIPASPAKVFVIGLVLALALTAGVGFGWHPALLACLAVGIILLVISFFIEKSFSDEVADLRDSSTTVFK